MNVDLLKFRCSSLGKIMTDKFGLTAQKECIKLFVEAKYGRTKHFQNKYTEKGTINEEASIDLYSQFKKQLFKNNHKRMSNEFISGEWDLIANETVIDIKTSWDIFTFTEAKSEKIKSDYYWQLQGYMELTGLKKATLAYCLVSTPPNLIESEKKSLWWKLGCPDIESKEFIELADEIDRLSIYDDIDIKERVIEHHFDYNEADIEKLQNRITECRNWIKNNLID